MTGVSVLGLGLMGSALASAWERSGFDLSVWNRSQGRYAELPARGMTATGSVAEAVAASPFVVLCVDKPDSVQALLNTPEVAPHLDGKTVIQLSTCLPSQADEAECWLRSLGASYLDGAILCGPAAIGTSDGQLLICGKEEAYARARDLIGCLGDGVQYLGENVRAASTLDLAWLSTRFGKFMGMIHAANLCRSQDVDLSQFMALFPDDAQIQHHVGTIRDGNYDAPSATLKVWSASLDLLVRQAEDAGINAEFPEHVALFFERAAKAGYQDAHVMSLYKVMRDAARRDV
ncbi:NAD(P)-dependent oxidoreductase [Albidovulum sediminicola]|uniref:NAD(P)-binding domain-containing protein n=1 Tax=Albidovulum sediminicola TaxID=2984331 RepID=A0ABT2Z0I7_9RHOB|nr:NAD(P)-binding domain-containing protein [Defluviimonas sp. WL0075]MCV2864668.1 NAD(P)-binding domain-containing protein [Defluviimonas sp. WL0075]